MMEILFRGRRTDNGEWVYGTPIYEGNSVYILSGVVEANEEYICIEDWRPVVPETVGQYTGLDDKNGVKIFEGDVISAWSQGWNAVGEVKHRIDGLWFMYPAYQHKIMWGLCPNHEGKTSVEVIGNIHDNPELPEVQNENS